MTIQQKPNKETYQNWSNDPNNWKWGIFYFNKEDKRIFPPKKSRLGWTINFSNPLSIIVQIIIIGIVIVIFRNLK